jgi:hypothetical protein
MLKSHLFVLHTLSNPQENGEHMVICCQCCKSKLYISRFVGDEDPIVPDADDVQARDDGGKEDARTPGEFMNKFYE